MHGAIMTLLKDKDKSSHRGNDPWRAAPMAWVRDQATTYINFFLERHH